MSEPQVQLGLRENFSQFGLLVAINAFVSALVEEIPPAPERQADIVAANRAGRPLSPSR